MSKVSAKINKIKQNLDDISGLDGDFVYNKICCIDDIVSKMVQEICCYEALGETNGTIFENNK